MRKLAFILPSVVLGLYACANADSDLGEEPGSIPATKDAGTDASTGRKDGGGTASPPKDSGASSSGGKDGGSSSGGSSSGGSSSGGSSSSSGTSGSGSVSPECDSDTKLLMGGIIAAGGTLPPGIDEIDSCSECHAGSDGCCAAYTIFPQGTYCFDPAALAGASGGVP